MKPVLQGQYNLTPRQLLHVLCLTLKIYPFFVTICRIMRMKYEWFFQLSQRIETVYTPRYSKWLILNCILNDKLAQFHIGSTLF